MTSLKSIGDGKAPSKPKCPYCGISSVDDHPDYTCPRISAASWGGDGGGVEFIDPERWEVVKRTLLSGSD